MKSTNFPVVKYEADDGKVFDWANLEEHYHIDPETKEKVQEHLYAKILYIGAYDSIDNYVEVDAPVG